MFVLWSLITLCLRSVFAPFFGMNQPMALVNIAQPAIESIASSQTHPLVPIHAPTFKRLI